MKKKKNYYGNERTELLKFLPENYTHILEIGCGEGLFSRQLSDCEKSGIEPVPAAAKRAEKIFSHVYVGTFEQVASDIPDRTFDLVIINDVLEHMPDSDWFLHEIQKKMVEGGHIVGSVPNMRYYPVLKELLYKRDWHYVDAGVLDRTHLRFFTQKSLERSLKQANLDITMLEGINRMRYFRSLRKIPDYFVLLISEILSLGYCRDLRFAQFAFQAKTASPSRKDVKQLPSQ